MKIQLAIITACSLFGFITLLPALADPDTDLPLHLQPLTEKSAALSMKQAKAKHISKKSRAKRSLPISMVQEEFHGIIDSPFSNVR